MLNNPPKSTANLVKNAILQKYVSQSPNDAICIDISYFNKKDRYLVGIDLASRV